MEINPEFEKYQKALERVNREIDSRHRKLLQIIWTTEPFNKGATGPLATAPFLTELGWVHAIHKALDQLADINTQLERLRSSDPARHLTDRLFEHNFRDLLRW
jgi:hypothetical protein